RLGARLRPAPEPRRGRTGHCRLPPAGRRAHGAGPGHRPRAGHRRLQRPRPLVGPAQARQLAVRDRRPRQKGRRGSLRPRIRPLLHRPPAPGERRRRRLGPAVREPRPV
ncbi:hypothetical protein H4R21_005731, partial [Coemansia helicoidea]